MSCPCSAWTSAGGRRRSRPVCRTQHRTTSASCAWASPFPTSLGRVPSSRRAARPSAGPRTVTTATASGRVVPWSHETPTAPSSSWSTSRCESEEDAVELRTSPTEDWVVSVDDHVIEPPGLWEERLPKKYRSDGPRLAHADGDEFWEYEGRRFPIDLLFGAGKSDDLTGPHPLTYDDMRPG